MTPIALPDGYEGRVVTQPLDYRAAVDGAPSTLSGYAAVFDTETVVAGLFREVIKPTAFTDAMTRDNVRALFNHDPNFVLGRTPKTLTLAVDAVGLRYDVTLPDTTYARDLAASVARGDVTQSSFAFRVPTNGDFWPRVARGELPLREIRTVELWDVSPVTFPAYATTTVAVRAMVAAVSDELIAHARRCNRLRQAEREAISNGVARL